MDLRELTDPGTLPTFMDYSHTVLSHLTAAWLEIESICGDKTKKEAEVEEAARRAAETLVDEAEARQLLRSSWSTWQLYLQTGG